MASAVICDGGKSALKHFSETVIERIRPRCAQL